MAVGWQLNVDCNQFIIEFVGLQKVLGEELQYSIQFRCCMPVVVRLEVDGDQRVRVSGTVSFVRIKMTGLDVDGGTKEEPPPPNHRWWWEEKSKLVGRKDNKF